MFKHIKTYLLTGLVVVIPAATTLYIFYYVFRWINSLIERMALGYFSRHLPDIPGATMILSIAIVFLIGILASVSIGRTLLNFIDSWLRKVPIFSELYFTIKQASKTILIQEKGFKRAVLVEYPRRGIFTLGFVTGESYPEIKESTGNDQLINIFIPTSPNPTSGYIVFVPKSDLMDVDISVQEAIKIIISGGFLEREKLGEK